MPGWNGFIQSARPPPERRAGRPFSGLFSTNLNNAEAKGTAASNKGREYIRSLVVKSPAKNTEKIPVRHE